MKSAVNIIKYNLREQRNLFIIEGSILVILTILSLVIPSWVSVPVFIIPTISTMLAVNFIISIIKFAQGISSDEGRVLFLAPIKGWQYLFAKNLEFIITQASVILLGYIGTLVSSEGSSLVAIVGLSTGFGLTIAYVLITAFIPIVASYFRKTFVRVVMTIIAFVVYSIFGFIIEIVSYFLPYVYMSIGDFTEINLVGILLNLISFGIVIWLAIYHIDNKLDII